MRPIIDLCVCVFVCIHFVCFSLFILFAFPECVVCFSLNHARTNTSTKACTNAQINNGSHKPRPYNGSLVLTSMMLYYVDTQYSNEIVMPKSTSV
jgi:hypothetical protein